MRRSLHVTLALLLGACGGGTSGPSTPAPPPPPPPPVAGIAVSPDNVTLVPQETISLTATPRDASGIALSGRVIAWLSTVPAVASVDASGLVTAVASGVTNVTATTEGKVGSATVTVRDGGFIGPSGGQAVTAAGNVTVLVPAGALSTSSALTITAVSNPQPDPKLVAGSAYEFGPVGTTFNQAVTIRIKYDAGSLTPGANQALLRLAKLTGPAWVVLPGSSVDLASKTVTGQTTSFSTYGILETPVPVAAVDVSPGSGSMVAGTTLQLVATPRDAAGGALIRAVTWLSSNPSIATVSTTGLVTGLSTGGPVTITATSEGQSGSAQVTVLAPITSVTLVGALRTKVGDLYPYAATLRLADGTIVSRPITWGVLEANKANITSNGVLTPLQTGTITITARVDGVVWQGTTTGYDWQDLSSGGAIRAALEADVLVTNKYGTSAYPTLVISCTTSGYFFLYVMIPNAVTANGIIAYSFDNGTPISATWQELSPDFDSLWHPGPSGTTKAFALLVGSVRLFGFGFGEYNFGGLGIARATIFRVTGLSPRLTPILAGCPSNFPSPTVAGGDDAIIAAQRLGELRKQVQLPEAKARQRVGPSPSITGGLRNPRVRPDSQAAVRQPQRP